MSYLINETDYFVRELVLPDTSEIDVSSVANPFDNWIDTEARNVLQGAFGFVLFDDFDSNVVNGVYVPAVPKWDRMVNGAIYLFEGQNYKYEGLLFQEGAVQRSLLAYYVFSKWMKPYLSTLTVFGDQAGFAANSIAADGRVREVNAWNNFVRLYGGDVNIWQVASGISRDSDIQNTRYVSLLKFLLQNKNDYPDAALKVHGFKNRFSI